MDKCGFKRLSVEPVQDWHQLVFSSFMLMQRTGPGKLLHDTVFSRLNAWLRINAGSKSGSRGMIPSDVYLWYNEFKV